MGRKKKVVITQEELKEANLQRGLKDLIERLDFVSEPTHIFNVGDKVLIGNLENVIIEEVLQQGKIYRLDYSSTNNNYGNPITTDHCKMYVSWTEVRKYQESLSMDLIKNKDLRMQFSQQTISSLLSKVYNFGVDFNPEYQRDFVWELDDKVALIDSIFNNVEIGKFVFINLGYDGKFAYEILDGKQRLKTLVDFYEDRFQFKDRYFSDLSKREQWYFTNYSISVAETNDLLTREQKLRYFINLNKNGKVMSNEQLNKVEKMLENIKQRSK